jgi:hypothetical protein
MLGLPAPYCTPGNVPHNIFYSNKIDIVNFLKNDSLIELYGLSFLNFEKFIKLKKGFINKKLCKLLPKKYYNFINIYL